MNPMIQWGVLGYARIAQNSVMPAIQRSCNGRVRAIASRDEHKLTQARQDFDIPKTYSRYEDLLADPEIQAVYIPLPNALHCPWTIAALEAGKHVLCEKPLGLDAKEVRRMADAARANDRLLMEAFMYRYSDRTRQLEAILASGQLGKIRHVNASFRFNLASQDPTRLDPALGGGALYDVGCYPINLLGLITGGKKPVSCQVEATLENGADTNLSALLHYEDGLIAAIHCGFNAHPFISAEIVGTEAALIVPHTFLDLGGEIQLIKNQEVRTIPVAESNRYLEQVEDFSAAILEGRSPKLGLDESIRNMEIIDLIYARLRAGSKNTCTTQV